MISYAVFKFFQIIDRWANGPKRLAHFKTTNTILELHNIAEWLAFRGRPRERIKKKYWHGTCLKIADAKFLPFSHFGTKKQAGFGLARSATRVYEREYVDGAWRQTLKGLHSFPPGASEGTIYEVRLSLRRPLRIEDTDKLHNLDIIAYLIDSSGILPRRICPLIKKDTSESRKRGIIIKELVSSGYDDLIYANTGEGLNDDSIMIVSHTQVKVVRRHSALDAKFSIHNYLTSNR